MHLGCSGLKRYLLLVAQSCKVTIFIAGLALELFGKTLVLSLHTWNIYLFFDVLGLDQISSCRVALVDCVHLNTSCDSVIRT